jgi:hypothetical protein
MNLRYIIIFALSLTVCNGLKAQQQVHYSGTTMSNPSMHDGQLSPVMGVHNIQILRANREYPSAENGNGWTYNHQPMMAYWHGKFYVHYLCDPESEQVPPSHTLIQSSEDGYHWTNPQILFPEYNVPEGFRKPGVEGEAHNLKAVMHQRQGFYVSSEGQLFALGTYGVCLNPKDHNNDGNGIGRVIRQVKANGQLGPIYFIYYNHGFGPQNTDYPNYKKCDRALRKACEEILASPRMRMGWAEEADRGDSLIPLNKEYKAYNDYTLPDGRIVALWKNALTSISNDGGRTWSEPVERAKGFVNSNAKIWGQRLSDGTYATVYNPSEYRWPLAISLSKDGIDYTTLNLVNGEVPPMRYGGNYKSYGPQYVRGILEGNGKPKDGNLWVAYSMNKEDIWVGCIPVPVITEAHQQANDNFETYKQLSDLTTWNVYSPKMAPVEIEGRWLKLSDEDPFDYARVDRMIPQTKELTVDFDLQAAQNSNGLLQIEFMDDKGVAASRIELTRDGLMRAKGGARFGNMMKYLPDHTYHVKAVLSVANRMITVYVDGKEVGKRMFFAPVPYFSRVMFRTGEGRSFPTIDTPADWYGIQPHAGEKDTLAVYRIANFRTSSADDDAGAAFLKADSYRHYVDYFNSMEDENIVQAIPNAYSWDWMKANIPLFECPEPSFEQMYYYRWWTLRKHIELTDEGYAMTEFLVKRNYADKYNLIASALGHHIHESRWLRNPVYMDQDINIWFHGNNGAPLSKLGKFSSWVAQSLWDCYLVDGRKQWIMGMKDDLIKEYSSWDSSHRLSNGLFWQEDVRDAMEESISGGRKMKYARPSINSYMYGNARAIAKIASLCGDNATASLFNMKADTIKNMVQKLLWNDRQGFFETLRTDSSANVREAIGFLPWYVEMPDNSPKYSSAWLQTADSKGFSAPFGLTTAERRHPLFRSHGTGQCEWDGAVWPFATSQTLTAMANYINDYANPIVGDSLFYAEMEKYVQCQSYRGKPYIGEYLDECTGYWLKGDQERSRYYNHSTFCDLIITGIAGLRPREDSSVEVNPLLPKDKWDWFCLDNLLYHGHNISIVWDKYGDRYHAGKGLNIYVDGQLKGHNDTLGKVVCNNVL